MRKIHNQVGIISYSSVLTLYIFALNASREIENYNHQENVAATLKNLARFTGHFFTTWTFGLQILFLVVAILDESCKHLNVSIDIQKRLSRTRAFVFNTFVFPCSLLEVTVFWGIWHIDRELIFPKVIDDFFPVWLNHTLHTFILVPVIIELLLPKKYNFLQFKRAAVILFVYVTVYQCLYVSVYLQHGIWLYPIYDIMDWPQRFLFTLLQLAVGLAYQKIGIEIQNSKKLKIKQKTK